MESALLCNVLERVGLQEPDASDYDDEYANSDEGALGEVHEFPGSAEPEIPEKKEVIEAQSQPRTPVFNRVKTSKPISYNDASEIGDSLRNNIPVIFNLNYTDKPEGQRMVDLVPGLRFGLEGKPELVGEDPFLLTSRGVAMTIDQRQTPSFLPSRYQLGSTSVIGSFNPSGGEELLPGNFAFCVRLL